MSTSNTRATGTKESRPLPLEEERLLCDVIMKGGITSGVVYPAAGLELAKIYTLKNIGGASAGAIAASLFAAAEYRRSVLGSSAGFNQLAALPEVLGTTTASGTSFLLSLFRPAPGTQRAFRLFRASLEHTTRRKLFVGLRALVAGYPHWLALGLLPGLAIGWAAFSSSGLSTWVRAGVIVLAVITLALVGLVVPVAAAIADAVKSLATHQFGICSGRGETRRGGPPPLTDWIEQTLDDVAFGESAGSANRPVGYSPTDPLTFADLWGAGGLGDRARLEKDKGGRRINLEVMTTCLTQGRPYRLPFDTRTLYFRPDEMRKLFSKRIVDFMVGHQREGRAHPKHGDVTQRAIREGLVPLPAAADLPVAVAVRLSLSFPLLISAVPLWGFDFSWAARNWRGEAEEPRLVRCWFSDGGITSNFPIHFFDGPLPRWPTFGLNLTDFHPHFPYDPRNEQNNVWIPSRNGDGESETWSQAPDSGSWKQLAWFLGSIFDTMHNWRDNIQLRVPGYRDRIAQIHLRSVEGGMNLTMPPDLIGALSKRGRYAAAVLAHRFSNTPPEGTILDWNNHCWVRMRSAMSLLEQTVGKIRLAHGGKQGPTPYSALEKSPPSYPFPEDSTAQDAMLEGFFALAASWSASPTGLTAGAPQPSPELRIMPRV